MKTKVQKLTATRINVRLKLSEARDLLIFIEESDPEATIGTADKLAVLLRARLNKEENNE